MPARPWPIWSSVATCLATTTGLCAAVWIVEMTAMLRVDVGPARERQDLTQLLDRGRRTNGQKAPEAFLRSFYGNGGVMNPMVQILRQADTLELSPEVADSIAILNRAYTIKLDSLWTPVVKYLAALPNEYDQDEAYDRYRVARMASKARRVVTELFGAFLAEPELLPPEFQARAGEDKARVVADYVAGMTDRYAMLEHRRLFAIEAA